MVMQCRVSNVIEPVLIPSWFNESEPESDSDWDGFDFDDGGPTVSDLKPEISKPAAKPKVIHTTNKMFGVSAPSVEI